ncbi:MAG: glycosyltransferase family 4 protein [bacterium]|nr:glycosyltransferase family 4 protein [bacterium]
MEPPAHVTILVCHNHYQIRAGEDQVFAAEVALLRAHGQRVVTYTRDNAEITAMPFWRRLWSFCAAFHNPRTVRELRALVAREKPDVAQVHNVFPLISPALYWTLRRAGVPIVQTMHNFRFVCINGLLFRNGTICHDCPAGRRWAGVRQQCYRASRLCSLWYALILWWHQRRGTFTRAIDRYIALNSFTKKILVDAGFDAARITVKPNAAITLDAAAAPPPVAPYALFIGRLSQEKGVMTLLAAAVRVPELPLQIMGDGPLAAQARAFVAQAGATHIEFKGYCSQAHIAAALAQALVLVFPSECYENCPMTVINALTLGTPVVAARTGGVPDFVPEGRAGWLFPPGDVDALAARMAWVAAHADEVRTLRPHAQAWAATHFAPQQNYERLLQVYAAARPGACATRSAQSTPQQ